MKELYIASQNPHKITEMKSKLSPLGFTIYSLLDVAKDLHIEEDQDSFEGNALKKANALYDLVRKPVLADDSGLIVDALNGAPGVYSARYAGDKATDQDNNQLLLKNMQEIEDRDARFVTVMVLLGIAKEPIISKGFLEGTIAKEPFGEHGFGYDPIFIVKDDGRHLSEYTLQEKNRISHRGKALRKIIKDVKMSKDML